MAHMIDFSNNRSNIAFVGQVPWHGLGQQMQENQPLDIWMQEAGLAWQAEKSPVLFQDKAGVIHTTDNVMLYRSDTNYPLGVVTDRYKVVQPQEVLEFYSDLVATQGWKIDVAGSLDNGKRIWALAKTDAEIRVKGTLDAVETYLLLATSFDGTMATVGKFTSVRVVCQNTLSMSLSDNRGARVSVPHSRVFNADTVKEGLGIYASAAQVFEEKANILASRKMQDNEVIQYLKDVLVGKEVKLEDVSTRSANVIKAVFDKYRGAGMGSTLTTAEGTAWGALNAITEYITHNASRNTNNRMRSAWFGKGDQITQNAMAEALILAA